MVLGKDVVIIKEELLCGVKCKLGAGTGLTSAMALNLGMKQDFGNLFTSF